MLVKLQKAFNVHFFASQKAILSPTLPNCPDYFTFDKDLSFLLPYVSILKIISSKIAKNRLRSNYRLAVFCLSQQLEAYVNRDQWLFDYNYETDNLATDLYQR